MLTFFIILLFMIYTLNDSIKLKSQMMESVDTNTTIKYMGIMISYAMWTSQLLLILIFVLLRK